MFPIPFRKTALAVVALGVVSSAAPAAPIVVPAGLSPGDQYRLAFVTSTTRDATSADIADYNQFVTAAADTQLALAALGTTWTAIASTATVDARDNTDTNPGASTGVPIYLLDGTSEIAVSNQDLWDGTLIHPIFIAESGAVLIDLVWTGSLSDGTASVANYLASSLVVIGQSNLNGFTWISLAFHASDDLNHLYALSGVLEVPTPAPEPGPLGVLAVGLLGLAVLRWRHRSLCRPRASSALAILTRSPPLRSDCSTRWSPFPPSAVFRRGIRALTHFRCSGLSCGRGEAGAEKIEFSAPVHLSPNELELGDLTLGLAV